MKIALIIGGRLMNGGAEKVAAKLTLIWRALGHRTVVLVSRMPADVPEYDNAAESREYIPIENLTDGDLSRLHNQYGFDLVVVNDSLNSNGFARIVDAVHALPDVKLAVIIHHTANNWLYFCNNTRELFYDDLLGKIDVMVCVDRMWALWWYHRGAKAVYIPNPISVKPVAPCQSNNKDIIWVGRLFDKGKRAELAINIFALVLKKIPEARLIMVGGKTEALEKTLRRRLGLLCKSLGNSFPLNEKIEFTGFITNPDDRMRQSALHLFTSLTEVTCPQVVLEAQAVGIPTVALDMPVLRSEPGVVTAAGVDMAADSIVDILSDATKSKSLGLLGYENVRNRLAAKDIESSWQSLFSAMADDATLAAYSAMIAETLQTPESYGCLLDEIHRADAYFAVAHLPELQRVRHMKLLTSPLYVLSRVMARFKRLRR